MRRGSLLAALGLAALTLTSARASAFCRSTTACAKGLDCPLTPEGCPAEGAPVQWTRRRIPFRFSVQGPTTLVREEARAAVRAAFYRWSDTLCPPDNLPTSLRFEEGDDIFQEKPLASGEDRPLGFEPFGIYFRDLGWPYDGEEDSTLAKTNTRFGSKSGEVIYADIEVNTGSSIFSTQETEGGNDLQAVMTHEVGHYIGLAHSKAPLSIMVSEYCGFGSARCEKGKVAARRLAPDDIAAVCTLYPPGSVPDEREPNQAGCAAGGRCAASASEVPASGLVALAFVALAVAARRRYARIGKL